MEPPKVFSLQDLIKSTAEQLHDIQKNQPAVKDAVMKFSECEIELGVTVKADTHGKASFWVVEGGVGAGYENAQKVKLKFTAMDGHGVYAPVTDFGEGELPRKPKE